MPDLNNLLIYTIKDFQDCIRKGIISDSRGRAYLIVKGTLNSNYTVHIDRRVVSSQGTVISFISLIKEYGEDNITIGYELKPTGLPDLSTYRQIKKEQKARERKYK